MRAPSRCWVPEPVELQPQIVFRDEHLLVIDKPPGLPTTAPRPSDPSLTGWVRSRWSELRPHPTSRLDAQVSGLVTFALSRLANRRLLEARRAGAYQRVYLGMTLAQPSAPEGEWTWPISLDPRNPMLRVAGTGRGQREARTRYEVVASIAHATLLRMMPRTGRTHQLRVHAAEAGLPLFGDHAYRGPRRLTLEDGSVVTARRVMLHCVRVSFPWRPGELRVFEAPVRPDMERVWLALGGVPSALDPNVGT
jgi:23S rRNA-/tRNA-specific pseudouridylate synthase